MRQADDDPAEARWIWDDLAPGGLAFEVGANLGQSMDRLAALYTRVVGFEALEPAWEVARRRGDVRHAAVTSHDGTVTLRLLDDQARSGGHEAAERIDFAGLPELTVPAVTLDTVMDGEGIPDFVNMDIEGSELDALTGAPRLLATRHPSWFIEFHSRAQYDGCARLLKLARYDVRVIRHGGYQPHSRLWHAHGWLYAKGTHALDHDAARLQAADLR